MKNFSALSAAVALLFLPQIAAADETWMSDQYGEIIYEKDVGDTAVFSMAGGHPGSRVFIYLPGLAGNSTDRSEYDGYWIESAPGECSTEKAGVDGMQSDLWGNAKVTFDTPSYPSGFVLSVGSCSGAFTDEGWAEPS